MISVWLRSGSAVSLGAVGPMILGSVSVSLYCTILAFLLPGLAIALSHVMSQGRYIAIATSVSWSVSVFGYSVFSYYFVCWRLSVAAQKSSISSKVDDEAVKETRIFIL